MALSKPTEKNARHLDVQAGQYWLATANGLQSWPVVICDEDMVQTFFKSDWRPRSARQPDGMWKPGYRDGGMLAACRQFPVLFLGLTKLFWVEWNKLKPVDFELAAHYKRYDNNEILHGVYSKILELYDSHDLTHWKKVLVAQRVDDERHFRLEARCDAKPENYSRKLSPNSHEFYYRENDGKADEVQVPKIEKLIVDECVSVVDSDSPFVDGDSDRSLIQEPSYVHCASENHDLIKIYVEYEKKVFHVPRSSLSASPILQNLMTKNDTDGFHIKSPILSRIHSLGFDPISQYLNEGEYTPYLLDHPTRLANTDTLEQKGLQIYRSTTTYRAAQILHMPALKHLAARKFKVAEPGCRHVDFLNAVELIFACGLTTRTFRAAAEAGLTASQLEEHLHNQQQYNKADEAFKNWLTETLAVKLLDIIQVPVQSKQVSRIFEAVPKMARNVLRILGREKGIKLELLATREGIEKYNS